MFDFVCGLLLGAFIAVCTISILTVAKDDDDITNTDEKEGDKQ